MHRRSPAGPTGGRSPFRFSACPLSPAAARELEEQERGLLLWGQENRFGGKGKKAAWKELRRQWLNENRGRAPDPRGPDQRAPDRSKGGEFGGEGTGSPLLGD